MRQPLRWLPFLHPAPWAAILAAAVSRCGGGVHRLSIVKIQPKVALTVSNIPNTGTKKYKKRPFRALFCKKGQPSGLVFSFLAFSLFLRYTGWAVGCRMSYSGGYPPPFLCPLSHYMRAFFVWRGCPWVLPPPHALFANLPLWRAFLYVCQICIFLCRIIQAGLSNIYAGSSHCLFFVVSAGFAVSGSVQWCLMVPLAPCPGRASGCIVFSRAHRNSAGICIFLRCTEVAACRRHPMAES